MEESKKINLNLVNIKNVLLKIRAGRKIANIRFGSIFDPAYKTCIKSNMHCSLIIAKQITSWLEATMK